MIWNAVGRACGRVEGRGAYAFTDKVTAEYMEVETGSDRSAVFAWFAYSAVQFRAGLTTENTNHTKSEAQGGDPKGACLTINLNVNRSALPR